MKTDGRVVKAVASKFFVDTADGVKVCFARKKLKQDGNIFVGDCVSIARERDSFVIEEVKPRKNSLIRPYVSNIDVCFIVVACEPQSDFLLADKIIVNCHSEGIRPILIVNKCDISPVDTREYESVLDIIECSAQSGLGIDKIVYASLGKTVCFAGQSAVGKSSIINAILGSDLLEVGELAKKIKRGKNTTRRTEILPLADGTYLVDTCGFSMLEAVDMEPENLRIYFDDLEEFRPQCRFNTCTHIDEPDCAVKAHVGYEIGEGRYERYKAIFNELKQRRENRYQ
ncbi:MAG: ribosome small subunit-dependent GTPase A [Bacteroides sp.]|nr:ribosome small subunit-dependent GTPase A [Bacillota bacterium]MCM1394316.1 ribosome small subunit-dependent GTPase A [[Eubacterium] siraeum]MCM1455663.1 ribosome small subunit-dependent GTPase A [Bacteroides sp.]